MLACQERHGGGDLLGAAEPADRQLSDRPIDPLLRNLVHQGGVDRAGADGVHCDAGCRQFVGERAGEGQDRAL